MKKLVPYCGDDPYIFISYSHKNYGDAILIVERLQKSGYRVWYDEGIDPGSEWDENIATHVGKCGLFIALLSQYYIESSNCKDELNFARDLEKPRLLIYLENIQLPSGMRMRLNRLQAIHKYTYDTEDMFYEKLFASQDIGTCHEHLKDSPVIDEDKECDPDTTVLQSFPKVDVQCEDSCDEVKTKGNNSDTSEAGNRDCGVHGNNRYAYDNRMFTNVYGGKRIKIGRIASSEQTNDIFELPLSALYQNALIVGLPGSGKTNCETILLSQLYKYGIPFLAIEPTETQYRSLLSTIPDLQVFTPNQNRVIPFSINPFMPPENVPLDKYRVCISNAFIDAFQMSGVGKVLFESVLDNCYIKYGWHIDGNLHNEGARVFGVQEFSLALKETINESPYSEETKQKLEYECFAHFFDMINRNGSLFDTDQSVSFSDLLSKPTVIELGSVYHDEQKKFLINLLLINYRLRLQPSHGSLNHVVLIDSARLLFNKSFGNSLITSLLPEMRMYGTGIVLSDQTPQGFPTEALNNVNVKIAFKLIRDRDRRIFASICNMNDTEEDNLSLLNTGEAYVYHNGLKTPVRVKTDFAGFYDHVSDEKLIACMKKRR